MATKLAKLIQQTRQKADFVRKNASGLYVPRTQGDKPLATWPVCMTCKQDVDRVNVEDFGKDTVTIRAWCHDKEAVIKVEFPFGIIRTSDEDTWSHIHTAINAASFFDPSIA